MNMDWLDSRAELALWLEKRIAARSLASTKLFVDGEIFKKPDERIDLTNLINTFKQGICGSDVPQIVKFTKEVNLTDNYDSILDYASICETIGLLLSKQDTETDKIQSLAKYILSKKYVYKDFIQDFAKKVFGDEYKISSDPIPDPLIVTHLPNEKLISARLNTSSICTEHDGLAAFLFMKAIEFNRNILHKDQDAKINITIIERPIHTTEITNYSVEGSVKDSVEVEVEPMYGAGKSTIPHDIQTDRLDLNIKFGKRLTSLVTKIADAISKIANDESETTVATLASTNTRQLITNISAIVIPSKIYIPVLSGFYRSAEAYTRKDKYLKSLENLLLSIRSSSGFGSESTRGLSELQSVIADVKNLIIQTNESMTALLKRLTGKYMSQLMSSEPIRDNWSSGATEFDNKAFESLSRSISKLNGAARLSVAKNEVNRTSISASKMMENSKEMLKESVKRRMNDISLEYTSRKSLVPNDSARITEFVIRKKEEAYIYLYDTMIIFEEYLSKRKERFLSPETARNISRILSGWSILVSSPASLNNSYQGMVSKMLDAIYGESRIGLVINNNVANLRFLPLLDKDLVALQNLYSGLDGMMKECKEFGLAFTIVKEFEESIGNSFPIARIHDCVKLFLFTSAFDVLPANHLYTYRTRIPTMRYVDSTNTSRLIQLDPVPQGSPTAVYIRHSYTQLTTEDNMFVRLMKSISTLVLVALDQARIAGDSAHSELPGVERVLIGGNTLSQIDLVTSFTPTGNQHIIVDAVPLYISLIIGVQAYEKYFAWDAKDQNSEYRIRFEIPKSSRFSAIFSVAGISGKNTRPSDTGVATVVENANKIWEEHAGITSPIKRTVEIMNVFFDEINQYLIIRDKIGEDSAGMVKDHSLSGVGDTENNYITETPKVIKEEILLALKTMTLAIFDTIHDSGMSAETSSNEYLKYIESATKSISAKPENERFQELIRIIGRNENGLSDLQSRYAIICDLLFTQLTLFYSIVENVTYRCSNLIIQVTNALILKRTARIVNGTLTAQPLQAIRRNPREFIRLLAGSEAKVDMFYHIYIAIQLLSDIHGISIAVKDGVLAVDYDELVRFIDDMKSSIITALRTVIKVEDGIAANAYGKRILEWMPTHLITMSFEKVNTALGFVLLNYHTWAEYYPNAAIYDTNKQPKLNFRFGLPSADSYKLFQIGPLNNIRTFTTKLDQVAGNNNTLPACGRLHTELARKSGIFMGMIRERGRVQESSGFMPWDNITFGAIVRGVNGVSRTLHGTGIPPNILETDDLMEVGVRGSLFTPSQTPSGTLRDYRGGFDLHLSAGCQRSMAHLNNLNFPFKSNNLPIVGAIGVEIANNISTIYGPPTHGGIVEVLNRLMAKMWSALSIRGNDRFVIVRELAEHISNASATNDLFRYIEVKVGDTDNAVAIFPNTISTLIRRADETFQYDDTGNVRRIDLCNIRDWRGEFLYDVVAHPVAFSAVMANNITIETMRDVDKDRYLSILPQYMTIFSALLKRARLDIEIGGIFTTVPTRISGMTNNVTRLTHGYRTDPMIPPNTDCSHPIGIPLVGEDVHNNNANDELRTFRRFELMNNTDMVGRIRTSVVNLLETLISGIRNTYIQIADSLAQSKKVLIHMHDNANLLSGDISKNISPLSLLSTITFNAGGFPINMLSLGELGHKYTEYTRTVSWALAAGRRDLEKYGMVSLESVPWLTRMVADANIENMTGVHAIVNNIARMHNVFGALNLTATSTYNPHFACAPCSTIVRGRSLAANIACIETGYYVAGRGKTPEDFVQYMNATHREVPFVLPNLATPLHVVTFDPQDQIFVALAVNTTNGWNPQPGDIKGNLQTAANGSGIFDDYCYERFKQFSMFKNYFRVPMGYNDTEAVSVSSWLKNKNSPKLLVSKQLGLGEGGHGFKSLIHEILPPSINWVENHVHSNRNIARLFMFMNRNPVQMITAIRTVVFPQITVASDTFDLAHQMSAAMFRRRRGINSRLGYPLTLRHNPFRIVGYTMDYRVPSRDSKSVLLVKPLPGWETDVMNDTMSMNGGDPLVDSITPGMSSIKIFYGTEVTVDDILYGFANEAPFTMNGNQNLSHENQNRNWTFFAMAVRFIDQLGIDLSKQITIRLQETKHVIESSGSHAQRADIAFAKGHK